MTDPLAKLMTCCVKEHEARQRELHGLRVEERQRVNGQDNGYRPITEEELQADKVVDWLYSMLHYDEETLEEFQ